MTRAVPPETDVFIARKRSLHFYVCTKERRGARWVRLVENLDLDAAMDFANDKVETCFEVGVLLSTLSGGYIYWTSTIRDVFNSPMLRVETSPQ